MTCVVHNTRHTINKKKRPRLQQQCSRSPPTSSSLHSRIYPQRVHPLRINTDKSGGMCDINLQSHAHSIYGNQALENPVLENSKGIFIVLV